MTLLQIGQVIGVCVVGMAAAVLLIVLVLTVLEWRRQIRRRRDEAAGQARQVLVDVFAELRAQRQADAQDARVELIRAAHAAMIEAERRRSES